MGKALSLGTRAVFALRQCKENQNKNKTHLQMSELQSILQYCFAPSIRNDSLKTEDLNTTKFSTCKYSPLYCVYKQRFLMVPQPQEELLLNLHFSSTKIPTSMQKQKELRAENKASSILHSSCLSTYRLQKHGKMYKHSFHSNGICTSQGAAATQSLPTALHPFPVWSVLR